MKVFVDASVVLAVLGSKSGGSSLILQLGEKRKLELVTSATVIEEVRRNAFKIGVSLASIERLAIKSKLFIIPAPTLKQVEKYETLVGQKDAHVVASAMSAKSNVITTLDRKHLLQESVKQKVRGLEVLTPGELLQHLVVTG